MQEKIESLLQQADRMAGPPGPVSVGLQSITRRHVHRRRKVVACLSIAAAIIFIAGAWQWTVKVGRINEQKRVAAMETDLQLLRAQTNATLKVVNELLERQRRQQRIDELRAKLAAIEDPLEKVNEEIEKTAFIIVYYADKKWQRPSQRAAAIEDYKSVLRLFPDTRSAEKAKQRLGEIENQSETHNNSKGNLI